MFYEWVAAGAKFGISAFFAVFVFLMFCAAFMGFVTLIGSFFKAGNGENGEEPRKERRDDFYRG